MNTEILLTGLAFGEGPRWRDGYLWFSDFYRHGIFRVDENGTEELVLEVPTQPSGLGWLPNGNLVFVSMLDRCLKQMDPTGEVSAHADLSHIAGGPCNDMVVGADGTAYVGNFGFEQGEDFAQATLAIVDADGTTRSGPDGLDFPNGTVINPEGNRLVIAESYGRRLLSFDIERDGSLTGRQLFADLGERVPDGICLDVEGGIWVGDPANHSVFRVVDGGEITHHIDLELNCYACALGGEDRRTLYLVTAPTSGRGGAADRREGRIERIRVETPGTGSP
ncbi:MAG: SMP-30/gluconolactonase/LRE family protein [Actinomycetota bacterium]|nr:gluconolactonase [Acidimicrobiaceae bacterium]MEC7873160.1 SMP-30/gluconolactonase/LRE family protein [Actinomycetota bacterium]MEC8827800.1 SMP-30/gluconolactonase/LRE family protein [Actinomycetota bacterium]MEC8924075.1 SMP-30/gluconolactonase/LRE family protein [Actinomycetota bacterium]MEC8976011.1 SMP-30/gluconolactonase/LRE family protein [Actinomycetota bacterium]|tara:strand:+ start:517 stop:1353 length:837 start_codon:yes stop_codon:yes gene_type:complete